MAHPAHKIAGPMLRDFDLKTRQKRAPATPDQVSHALSWPQAMVPTLVHDEWVNEARRKNGMPSTSAIIGAKFRADQELRRRPKVKATPVRPSRLQRIARRISRLFRNH
jgi:hypothetical protein